MTHFDIPTEVIFKGEYDYYPQKGIAYKDEIICLCCGGITPLDEAEVLRVHTPWKKIETLWGE